MNMTKQQYIKYAESRAAKSKIVTNCLKAFVAGGLICVLAQGMTDLYKYLGVELELAKTLSLISVIFLTAVFTGFGIFDNFAKHAGAGSFVPITGFANSMVSPAIDNKEEGFVLGVAAKMFIIAGPVIVYGTIASIIYGLIYFLFLM
ncbi:MAG: SpoVA/SpoVAEb family sporulation membrane protein [Eubacteriales bacterium]